MKKVLKLIQGFNSSKAHEDDVISIKMVKICGPSIIKSLSLLYIICSRDGIFPKDWENANVFPVHKKRNKHLVCNYCLVSLFPICFGIFEKSIFLCIYNSLDEIRLIKIISQASRLVTLV